MILEISVLFCFFPDWKLPVLDFMYGGQHFWQPNLTPAMLSMININLNFPFVFYWNLSKRANPIFVFNPLHFQN